MTETTHNDQQNLWDTHRRGGKLLLQRQRVLGSLPLQPATHRRYTSRTTGQALKNCINPEAFAPRNPVENKRRVWFRRSA